MGGTVAVALAPEGHGQVIDELRKDAAPLCAIVLLDLVAAACIGRLFTTAAPLLPILVAVLAGHAVAFGCRMRRFTAGLTSVVVLAAAALLMVWLVLPGSTLLGLPTPDTLKAVGDGLSQARQQFSIAIAPTPPVDGFTMVSVFLVTVLVALADWGAFRLRATIEATIPAFTIFTFSAVLGTTTYRAHSTIAFAAALLIWFVAHNSTVIARTRPWFNGTAAKGRDAVSKAGIGVTCVALVAVSLGLAVPFTKDPPAVAWRNRGNSEARTTVSPLVDIRSRLVARDDVIAFTVDTAARSYWRLTSLDLFDGRIWSSRGSYKEVDETETLKDRTGDQVEQHYTIGDLKSIWLPVAYRPAVTPSVPGISYDKDADAFITEQPTSDGLDYTVTSAIAKLDAAALRSARPLGIDSSQLELPSNIDPRVRSLATSITQGATTPYDKALAIQNYFRGGDFTYDLAVQPGHGEDAVVNFLFNSKRGYCEQFAGTFAVLARLAGLPTRVSVGFTPGDVNANGTGYVVRELNAHAWPEVFLGSAGWVAFEPTPGRGIPGAESYTGAVESQADSSEPGATSTVPTTVPTFTGEEEGPGATTTTTAAPVVQPEPAKKSGALLKIIGIALIVILAIGAAVSAVPLIMAGRRRRRWANAEDASARVLVAWQDTTEALTFAGARVRRSDTPLERIDAVSDVLGEGGVATLERLATNVDVAAYAPPQLSETDAAASRADADEVRRLAYGTKPAWRRALYLVHPKRLRRR